MQYSRYLTQQHGRYVRACMFKRMGNVPEYTRSVSSHKLRKQFVVRQACESASPLSMEIAVGVLRPKFFTTDSSPVSRFVTFQRCAATGSPIVVTPPKPGKSAQFPHYHSAGSRLSSLNYTDLNEYMAFGSKHPQ